MGPGFLHCAAAYAAVRGRGRGGVRNARARAAILALHKKTTDEGHGTVDKPDTELHTSFRRVRFEQNSSIKNDIATGLTAQFGTPELLALVQVVRE